MNLFVCFECGCEVDHNDPEANEADYDNLTCAQCLRDPGWLERAAEEAMRETSV